MELLSFDSWVWRLKKITNTTKWSVLMLMCYIAYLHWAAHIRLEDATILCVFFGWVLLILGDWVLGNWYDDLIADRMDELYNVMLTTSCSTESNVVTLVFDEDLILKTLSACAYYKTTNPDKLEEELKKLMKTDELRNKFDDVRFIKNYNSVVVLLSNSPVTKEEFDSFPAVFNMFKTIVAEHCSKLIGTGDMDNDEFITAIINSNIMNVLYALFGDTYDSVEVVSACFAILTLLDHYINTMDLKEDNTLEELRNRIKVRKEAIGKLLEGLHEND